LHISNSKNKKEKKKKRKGEKKKVSVKKSSHYKSALDWLHLKSTLATDKFGFDDKAVYYSLFDWPKNKLQSPYHSYTGYLFFF
jgi:hypothetical protein